MPAAYSVDLRQSILSAYNAQEGSQRQLAKWFKVSLSFALGFDETQTLGIVYEERSKLRNLISTAICSKLTSLNGGVGSYFFGRSPLC